MTQILSDALLSVVQLWIFHKRLSFIGGLVRGGERWLSVIDPFPVMLTPW